MDIKPRAGNSFLRAACVLVQQSKATMAIIIVVVGVLIVFVVVVGKIVVVVIVVVVLVVVKAGHPDLYPQHPLSPTAAPATTSVQTHRRPGSQAEKQPKDSSISLSL